MKNILIIGPAESGKTRITRDIVKILKNTDFPDCITYGIRGCKTNILESDLFFSSCDPKTKTIIFDDVTMKHFDEIIDLMLIKVIKVNKMRKPSFEIKPLFIVNFEKLASVHICQFIKKWLNERFYIINLFENSYEEYTTEGTLANQELNFILKKVKLSIQ